jgi:hypothetical protein
VTPLIQRYNVCQFPEMLQLTSWGRDLQKLRIIVAQLINSRTHSMEPKPKGSVSGFVLYVTCAALHTVSLNRLKLLNSNECILAALTQNLMFALGIKISATLVCNSVFSYQTLWVDAGYCPTIHLTSLSSDRLFAELDRSGCRKHIFLLTSTYGTV